jgi:hypothetical protein
MIQRSIIFSTLVGLLLIASCTKESSQEFNAYSNNPLNDTVWAVTLKSTDAANTMITDLMPPADSATINLAANETEYNPGNSDSLKIFFSKGIFTSFENGVFTPVPSSGNAVIQVIRIRRNGDLIRLLRPSQTTNAALELGGGVFIRIMKDGKELGIKQGETIRIRLMENGGMPKSDMRRFFGAETIPPPMYNAFDPGFSWQPDNDNSPVPLFFDSQSGRNTTGYEIRINRLRWISVQRLLNSTTAIDRSRVTVILPPNFTNKTTNVFALIGSQKTVVKLEFDYNSRSFRTDLLPTGAQINLVSISKIGKDFYLAESNINRLSSPTIIKLEPGKKGQDVLQSFLDNL